MVIGLPGLCPAKRLAAVKESIDSSSTQAASINTGSLMPVASVSKIMVLDMGLCNI